MHLIVATSSWTGSDTKAEIGGAWDRPLRTAHDLLASAVKVELLLSEAQRHTTFADELHAHRQPLADRHRYVDVTDRTAKVMERSDGHLESVARERVGYSAKAVVRHREPAFGFLRVPSVA